MGAKPLYQAPDSRGQVSPILNPMKCSKSCGNSSSVPKLALQYAWKQILGALASPKLARASIKHYAFLEFLDPKPETLNPN